MNKRAIQQRFQRRRGQALSEFVVVVPLFIVMLFFAWYFSDLVQLRLDNQEIARLVAWEPTNRMMHDFRDGRHRDKQRDTRQDGARKVRELYRDMDPTRDGAQMPRKLTIDRAIEELKINLSDGPAPNNSLLASGFEKQGIVEGEVTTTAVGLDDFFPHNMLLGERFADNPFAKMRQTLRFTDKYRLLADSWRLHDGQDVLPGQGDKAFTKQVDRVAWSVEGLQQAQQSWGAASAVLGFGLGTTSNPFETVVASRNYTGNAASGRRTGAHGLEVSGGQDDFDTAPMRTEDRDGSGSVYGRSLEARSDHYLGCKNLKPEAECFR
jgi:hypothetical protein